MSKCDFWQFWLGIQNFPKLSLLKLVNFKICWAIYPIEDQFRLEISRKIFSIWVIPRTYCSLKFTSIARRKIYTRTVTLRSDKSMLLNFTNLIIFCNKPKFFCDSNCMFSKTSQNVFLISRNIHHSKFSTFDLVINTLEFQKQELNQSWIFKAPPM